MYGDICTSQSLGVTLFLPPPNRHLLCELTGGLLRLLKSQPVGAAASRADSLHPIYNPRLYAPVPPAQLTCNTETPDRLLSRARRCIRVQLSENNLHICKIRLIRIDVVVASVYVVQWHRV